MNCTLDVYSNYDLANVKHDVALNKYVVKLNHPPGSCPDGVFVSKKAVVKIVKGLESSTLSYNTAENVPVISVGNKSFIQEINIPESNFMSTLFWIGLFALGGWLVYKLFNKLKNNEYSTGTGVYSAPVGGNVTVNGTTYPPSAQPVTINNNSNGGLLQGMLLGHMFAGNTTHETIIERPYVEHDTSNSDSSDDSSSSYSSSDDSYSSSSSDSFSSDSGSSFSSDS